MTHLQQAGSNEIADAAKQPDTPRRVAYLVSPDLINSSDALACHPGRSKRVHSLISSLGLLQHREYEEESVEASSRGDDGAVVELLDRDEHALLQELLDSEGLDDGKSGRKAVVITPPLASRSQLTVFHDSRYVDALLSEDYGDHADDDDEDGSAAEEGLFSGGAVKAETFGLVDDCAAFRLLPLHVRSVAGASIHAAEMLAKGEADVAIVWDGGRHHAHKARAAGFCYANDIVLAILALRKPRKLRTSLPDGSSKTELRRLERVLYLDLDLHWGDGVEEAFSNSASVKTISVHRHAPGFFPRARNGTGGSLESSTEHVLNLPLQPGASSQTLRRVYDEIVSPAIQRFNPHAIVVQCGTDGAAGDPHAIWNLSTEAYTYVIKQILHFDKPLLLLGGGGYNMVNTARIWASITAAVCRPSSDTLPTNLNIPQHEYWPEYAPDFALDVAAGEMRDENDETHLQKIRDKLLNKDTIMVYDTLY